MTRETDLAVNDAYLLHQVQRHLVPVEVVDGDAEDLTLPHSESAAERGDD